MKNILLMKKVLFILILSFSLWACDDQMNSIEVINNSNHGFVFSFGKERPLDYSELLIEVDSGLTFIYYGIDPGSVWIYYASRELEEVYKDYLGGIGLKDKLVFTIDTIFEFEEPFKEKCGICEFVTDDGAYITYGTPLLFCGDSYLVKLNSSPATVDGVTTYWNCY